MEGIDGRIQFERPAAAEPTAVEVLRDDPTSRKRFLSMAGAGAAGGLAVLLAACGDDDKTTSAGARPASTAESTPVEARRT